MPAMEKLKNLLAEANLTDKAQKVGDSMYRLRWGSATVIAGTAGDAIVVIAPLFDALPSQGADALCKRLLEINGTLGGTAAFAISSEGAVVLQVGRGLQGLDADEFSMMLGTVGKFADDYDDKLRAEFYK